MSEKKRRLAINLEKCDYALIREVAETLKFKPSKSNAADLFWCDMAQPSAFISRLRPYQKVNHWPGMYTMFRKNNLGKLLMEMKRAFPDYDFFPETYIFPYDRLTLSREITKMKDPVFIVKPASGSQGNGIFLVNKL